METLHVLMQRMLPDDKNKWKTCILNFKDINEKITKNINFNQSDIEKSIKEYIEIAKKYGVDIGNINPINNKNLLQPFIMYQLYKIYKTDDKG